MTKEWAGAGDVGRTLELLWSGVGEPETGGPTKPGPKRRLSIERIVTTAVRLADTGGLDALSMRNVAAELNVGVMGLYRYVPSKAELIDLMIDHLNGPADELKAHRDEDWRTIMLYTARSIWQLYSEHPWLLQVGRSRTVLGPNTVAGLDFALGAFSGTELTDREKTAIFSAVEHHVTGVAHAHLLREQSAQHTRLSEDEFWHVQLPYLEKALSTGMFPRLAELTDEDAFAADGLESMLFGVNALLDGIERQLESRRGG
ncbi:TetR/AcrR family transcriptional regulator [Actinophytocola gossypii]|uniref:TetR/AcrR family transcriptional regulator C-terminal domain-containing protein n=1 Tax=Actinophytocola gossypii TaxID=2812003 RepID=A0ABT2JH21_9PSEU|nr:TetR/AcrR family transcriptional regulator [Actinophytocola gossypii]MCT2587183.1 TetR/AcrR family transcriptional regulator C-terminal domain-containing protein [Actinophytocola gossypii]